MSRTPKKSGSAWDQVLKHIRENKPLTTFEVSRVCGVDHSTVSYWIDGGKLNAYKTPGGHRRIKGQDLLLFLKQYDMPVPPGLLEAGDTSSAFIPKNGHSEPLRFRILVVEDDPNLHDVVVETLKQAYPEVEILGARDGFQAGKQIASFLPDIIVLDLFLPGIDGIQIIENIRKDPTIRDIQILAVTGIDTLDVRMKVAQAGGAEAYLAKPLNLNHLKEDLNRLIKACKRRLPS